MGLADVILSTLVLVNIALQLIDGLSTWYIIARIKGGAEGNPVVKKAIDAIGLIPALAIYKGALIAFVLWVPLEDAALWGLGLVYTGIAINNIRLIVKYG